MNSLVHSQYLESEFGVPTDLEAAGTSLENPYAYDSAAQELKSMAEQGLVKIMSEHVSRGREDSLISRISFTRLR